MTGSDATTGGDGRDAAPTLRRHPFSSRVAGGVLAGAIVAAALLTAFLVWGREEERPPFARIHPVLSQSQRDSQSALENTWAEAAFAEPPSGPAPNPIGVGEARRPVDEPDPARVETWIERLVDGWRGRLRDPDGVLTDRQRNALLETLARHASARAAETPEPYLALADEESRAYHWLTATDPDRETYRFRAFYKSHLDKEPSLESPSAVRQAIRDYWGPAMVEAGLGFERIGVGPSGALLGVQFVRSDTVGPLFENEAESAYWTPPIHSGAAWTRRPNTSLAEYLSQRPSALVASALMLVELRYGFFVVWESYWYWNDSLDTWICFRMSMGSMRGPQVIF